MAAEGDRGERALQSREAPRRASTRAEEAFAEYLDGLEGEEAVPFEAFCAARPELSSELRQLERSWQHLSGLVQRLGLRCSRTRSDEAGAEGGGEPPELEELLGDDELLARIRGVDRAARYRVERELSRGGMGAVFDVWDLELRRPLAMKTMLARGERPSPTRVARFLEEAQVTGQLDHPGIVPVHELGLDQGGNLFFTMRLVSGRTLGQVFATVEAGDEGWSVTRALGVVLRVCETMAFAHERGVVHRDLKPSNVMVGRFGEVYVMDWGLAHVIGTEDRKDIRLAGEPAARVWTERREHARHTPDSPLVTMDGDVVGTPAYMSPEQAEGRIAAVGPASDVYSVGAILYQLLAGRLPYGDSQTPQSPHVLWRRVLSEPPAPLESLGRDLSPELVAITERAMARSIEDRYPTMEALASDLRAYLEGRVVSVYERGPVAELKKWVRRNRGFALACAALIVVTLAAALLYGWNESRRTHEIQRYANVGRANTLFEQAQQLGPALPRSVPAMQGWIRRARKLIAMRTGYEAEREALRALALPLDPLEREAAERAHPLFVEASTLRDFVNEVPLTIGRLYSGELPDESEPIPPEESARIMERYLPLHRERLARLRAEIERSRPWRFASQEDGERYAQLDAVCEALRRLEEGAMANVTHDLALAASVERAMTENVGRWAEARAAIAADPGYGGLDLEPQTALVPIGPDPTSGLWEFWHVLSGAEPERDAEGRLRVTEESGIVLVLLPGGRTTIGAQDVPGLPNHDPQALANESPVELTLDPFFLGKYELTQSQWLRLTGSVPSFLCMGGRWRGFGAVSGLHPVENVTWQEAHDALSRVGLELPTEARWEYGARARAQGSYWFGNDFSGEFGVNFRDASTRGLGVISSPEIPSDGFLLHCPVPLTPENAFGIAGVLGNVRELCLDRLADQMSEYPLRAGTGEVLCESSTRRIVRGGGFSSSIPELRLAYRSNVESDQRAESIGVRPARSIERAKDVSNRNH